MEIIAKHLPTNRSILTIFHSYLYIMTSSTSSSDDTFDAATTYVGSLAANGDVSETDLLKFYGLYKQATEGPCETPKPAFFDLKGRTKWAAWKNVGDISQEDSRTAYIDLLASLKPDWSEGASSKKKRSGGGAGGGVFSSLAHEEPLEIDDLVRDCDFCTARPNSLYEINFALASFYVSSVTGWYQSINCGRK